MKRTATELLHILVGQIFVLFLASNLLGRTEALGPFLPKPFERGWKPEDYGYTFVPRNHTLTRRTNGEIPDHFGDEMPGIRDHVKNLLPVKRSRIVGNGKKRSLDAAEVLYPSSVQFMFWSDDPSTVASGAWASMNIWRESNGPHLKRSGEDQEGIVDLDLFEDMLVPNGVQCSALDRTISLTFRESGDFSQAADAWRFVNEKGNRFIFVVAPPHCEDIIGESRVPFQVRGAQFDQRNGKIVLEARKVNWRDAIPSFELLMKQFAPNTNVGTYSEEKTGAHRGTFQQFRCDAINSYLHWMALGWAKDHLWILGVDKLHAAVQVMVGCANIEIPSWEVNLAKLFPFNSFVRVGLPFGIDATASFPEGGMRGKLIMDAYLRMEAHKIEEFSFKMRPRDVQLMGQLSLATTLTATPGWMPKGPGGANNALYSVTYPLGGLAVPNLIIVGPTGRFSVEYVIGEVSANGQVAAPVGLALPNDMTLEFEWDKDKGKLVNKSNLKMDEIAKSFGSFGVHASIGLNMEFAMSVAAAIQLAMKMFQDTPVEIGGQISLNIIPVAAKLDLGMQKSFTCDACQAYDWGFQAVASISGFVSWQMGLSLQNLPLPNTQIGIQKGATIWTMYTKVAFNKCKGYFEKGSRCLAKATADRSRPPVGLDFSAYNMDDLLTSTNTTMIEIS